MLITQFLSSFCILSTCTLIAFSISPMTSVVFLISTFVLTTIILFFFSVDFLRLVFVIVYVGAIAVLFLFVVMMVVIKHKKENLLAFYVLLKMFERIYAVFFGFVGCIILFENIFSHENFYVYNTVMSSSGLLTFFMKMLLVAYHKVLEFFTNFLFKPICFCFLQLFDWIISRTLADLFVYSLQLYIFSILLKWLFNLFIYFDNREERRLLRQKKYLEISWGATFGHIFISAYPFIFLTSMQNHPVVFGFWLIFCCVYVRMVYPQQKPYFYAIINKIKSYLKK